ncbi:hypothetical protein D6833_08920 [Candidatus Parcubacteria bacterium]|nr:MAG: hypothetical protein D6833_08920 [Candidatus Parcubacteria bacterium]
MKTWLALLPISILLAGCIPQAFTPSPTPTATMQPTATLSLRPIATETVVPSTTPEMSGTISTGLPNGRVNLRQGPGMHYRVLAVLSEGTTVTILRREANWSMVQSPTGLTGWVYSKFIAKGVAP